MFIKASLVIQYTQNYSINRGEIRHEVTNFKTWRYPKKSVQSWKLTNEKQKCHITDNQINSP